MSAFVDTTTVLRWWESHSEATKRVLLDGVGCFVRHDDPFPFAAVIRVYFTRENPRPIGGRAA